MSIFSIVLGKYGNQGEILYKFIRAFLELNYDHEDGEDLGELINEISFAYMCKDYLQLSTNQPWNDTFDELLNHERIVSKQKALKEDALPIVATYGMSFGDGLWDLNQFNQYWLKKVVLKYFKDESIALRVMDSILFIDQYSDYLERNQISVSKHFFDKYTNRYERYD